MPLGDDLGAEMARQTAIQALRDLMKQLAVSDSYARDAKPRDDRGQSVWEIQNQHLRDYARAASAALGETL